MSRTMLAALTLISVAACGRSDRRDVASADSLNRDLQLAPVDSTAPLNDRPSADTASSAATPAPPATPAPKPAAKPAAKPVTKAKPTTPAPAAAPAREPSAAPPAAAPAASAGLAAGTSIAAATDAEIRSNKNKVGDEVTATVSSDVKDASGRVVIPAGSQVTLKITAIKVSENKSDSTGTLTIMPTAVSINGTPHPIAASITGVKTKLEGRKTGAGDIAKVGVGTGVGAVVGRVIGGSTKGAIIGGVIGGAVGAQRAVETKDRDVVLPQGTGVTVTLDQKFLAQS
jgi:hypothetical protein